MCLTTSVLTWRATLRRSPWRPRDSAGRALHRSRNKAQSAFRGCEKPPGLERSANFDQGFQKTCCERPLDHIAAGDWSEGGRASAPALHYLATENAGSVLRGDIGTERTISPDSAG